MNSQTVTVNLTPGLSTPAVVKVSQYDVGRPLTFKVLDGTGTASISASATATVAGTKPSGLGFTESGTIAGNTVTLNTTLAMTQECGMIPAEIRFTTASPATVIGTANFILAVEPSPHLDGTTDGTYETMGDLQSQLNALDTRVDALEAGSGGSGLTQAEKNLILTLFSKAAYAEDDASTAYDALESLWASTTRTITYNLSHVTSSNTATSAEGGSNYTTTLTVASNYTLNTVTVLMGGVDITSTAYSSGTITIPSVTGNIVITATAVLAAQSITATYTQSGTVYDTDSLDSLKADLVVTANYSGGTSETVPASNYTLSGTLTEGTSTITVSYAGLTDTFTVTVTHAILPLYNWDFTQSLTDTVAGVTATLTGCTRDSSGVNFTAINQAIMLTPNKTSVADRTFVFEIPTYTGDDSGSYHARLFCSDSADTTTDSGAAGFVYRHGMGWTVYSGTAWGTSYSSTDYPINFFNGKKLKIYISSDLKLTVSYADLNSDTFTTIGTIATEFGSDYASGYWVVGGSRNNNLKNCVFSKITVYEGEV